MSSPKTGYGRDYNRRWGVGAQHALFHKDGTFYECLKRIPAALFDPSGYVLFNTETEYVATQGLSHGKKLNIKRGIHTLPGYRQVV